MSVICNYVSVYKVYECLLVCDVIWYVLHLKFDTTNCIIVILYAEMYIYAEMNYRTPIPAHTSTNTPLPYHYILISIFIFCVNCYIPISISIASSYHTRCHVLPSGKSMTEWWFLPFFFVFIHFFPMVTCV